MKLFLFCLLTSTLLCVSSGKVHAQSNEKAVLQVVHDFFATMEAGDSTAFRALFLPNAMIYTVREQDGIPVLTNRLASKDKFRPGTVIKERMKAEGVVVNVNGNMAQVWAPYNLWINDKYSHCGVDVFTLIETTSGWRIATLSYTIEKSGCNLP